ncbi:MAG: hypothetical protein ACKV2V_00555 [Blastocatellia bacterium]
MRYSEPLPEDCPPAEAEEITAARTVFRLSRSNPATLEDFRSQRAEQPETPFKVRECQARGLSVFADRADIEQVKKIHKFRNWSICHVQLKDGAGCIEQTGRPSHHTWWPLADFDILAHCRTEAV